VGIPMQVSGEHNSQILGVVFNGNCITINGIAVSGLLGVTKMIVKMKAFRSV